PLATPLAMRLGVAWTMLLMIAIGALAFVGFHFAPDFWMWFPLRVALHISLTVLFILSEFWISTSAPPSRRGLVLGIYATVLSLGFAAGPWLFAHLGSSGFLPFGVTIGLVTLAAIPVLAARNESPSIVAESETSHFLRYIW
ncbi:MFS transporter, partial [Mesorhizobium sp. M2C.T.Ca.TU.002.02.1.1]